MIRADDPITAKMVNMYNEGVSVAVIALETNYTKTAVYYRLRRMGVFIRGKGGRFPDEIRENVARDYAAGEHMSAIKAKYGISDHAIRTMAREHNIKLRPQGGQWERIKARRTK